MKVSQLLISSSFLTTVVYTIHISPMRDTCPARLNVCSVCVYAWWSSWQLDNTKEAPVWWLWSSRWSSGWRACQCTKGSRVQTRQMRWSFKGNLNPQHAFLRKEVKPEADVLRYYGMYKIICKYEPKYW
jgi:hypothetical protein